MSSRSLWILGIIAVFTPAAAAQPTKNPLRFVPKESEWVVKVDRPRELVEAVEKNEIFREAQKLTGIRDLYDSTTFQRVQQLITYYEKQLGSNRYELIDELAGGGMVLAAKVTPPGGAVLIMQSKDEATLRRFLDLSLDVIKGELDRNESKDKIFREKRPRGIDAGKIGPKVSFAIADGALIVASEEKALKAVLDTHESKKSIEAVRGFAEAHKKAPVNALAWTWMNVEEVRKNPDFQNGLNASSLDPLQMVLFGGITDLLKRTPHASAALTRDGAGYRIAITAPRGREGMAALSHMILPPAKGGTLPPLMPPRVISSSSYYLDLGQLWDKRLDILGEKNAKGFEEGEKNAAQILGGIKFSKLFKDMGPHQRLVVAQQKESPYKVRPGKPFPSIALVVDMRDPAFGDDMNTLLRSAALLATFQVGLKLKEETYKDCNLVSYYFNEARKVDGDPDNIRFNFSPTYVKVGNSFVMSGTAELARDLVDLLKEEKQAKRGQASMQTHLHAGGLADFVRVNEASTLTQLILAQALPPKTAKAELDAIIGWLEKLGTVQLESVYGQSDFRYDILWQPKLK